MSGALLTTRDLAAAFGVLPGCILKWVKRGAPVAQAANRRQFCQSYLFDEAAVRRWRAQQRDAGRPKRRADVLSEAALRVYFAEDELASVYAIAREHGVSASAFCRATVLAAVFPAAVRS